MRICVIGCGVIGSILVRYFAPSHRVWVVDHNPEKLRELETLSSVKLVSELSETLAATDLVILAVKPQSFSQTARELAPYLNDTHTVMSVIAGLTVAEIQRRLSIPRILRTMPNTAMSVGQGILAIAENPVFPAEDTQDYSRLLQGLGRVIWLPENKMDALTAVAGSGIAYMFLLLEAFTEAGIRLGFDSATALELAGQTMQGAHELVKQSGEHPASLKWKVCSPAGATVAGLHAMESSGVRSAIYEAIDAAHERVLELGQDMPGG